MNDQQRYFVGGFVPCVDSIEEQVWIVWKSKPMLY